MAAKRIHFIGGGQMAEAIIRAVIGKGAYEAAQISVADVNEERNLYLKNTYGIHAAVSQAAELGSPWRMWKGLLPCCATAASIRASFWTSTILRAASVSMPCMS